MLAEERTAKILSVLMSEGSVKVTQLMNLLDASESTIRRDLNQMDKEGLITKVHGGAILESAIHHTVEEEVNSRKLHNWDEKLVIGQYAATLVEPNDFVYIDAGSSTEALVDFIEEKSAVYVTNAVEHAKKLTTKGMKVYLTGGEFKSVTEAMVGEATIDFLDKYHFTKGFFGANGVTAKEGFTTPESREGMIKKFAMGRCKDAYVLADSSKFSIICNIKFGDFDEAEIITTNLQNKGLSEWKNLKEV